MQNVVLPSGDKWPALGLGTWHFGERASVRRGEVAAIRAALEMGYRLIDTAEMYGDGEAERVVGQALAETMRAERGLTREQLIIVSKVYPHNATSKGVQTACEHSLRRLGLDYLDLYLLHWRGNVPLSETVDGLQRLVALGKIRHWGVSNFDLDDMRELVGTPSGSSCACNQIYYAVSNRGPEFDLLPWMKQHAIPVMAYSPLDQGKLAQDRRLSALGEILGLNAAQLALGWVLRNPDVIAIPKAGNPLHLRENLYAAEVALSHAVLEAVDAVFPPPKRKQQLAVI